MEEVRFIPIQPTHVFPFLLFSTLPLGALQYANTVTHST